MKKTLFLFAIIISVNLFSQEKTVADKMLLETQIIRQTSSNLKLVWWIPTEYWRNAMQDYQTVSNEQVEYIENLLND